MFWKLYPCFQTINPDVYQAHRRNSFSQSFQWKHPHCEVPEERRFHQNDESVPSFLLRPLPEIQDTHLPVCQYKIPCFYKHPHMRDGR